MVGVVGALVEAGVAMPARAYEVERLELLARPRGALRALGVFLFCFAGHPCIPAIYATAQEPARFRAAARAAFALGGFYYALCGVLAYFFYGAAVRPSFTASLGRGLDGAPLPGAHRALGALC